MPAAQLLPMPDGVDLVTAAGLPEVACTVWSNVIDAGRLQPRETFLVQGGTSGIGTHAIQVAKASARASRPPRVPPNGSSAAASWAPTSSSTTTTTSPPS